jgi:hypothetical protein
MANTAQTTRSHENYLRHNLLYIYTQSPTAQWVPWFRMIRYSSEGKCFFGPLAKGLRSRRSLNLLQRNKLILRGATFRGLTLPKVLKNLINHLFSALYRLLQGASVSGWNFLPIIKAYEVKI